jgi:hypothetical protein
MFLCFPLSCAVESSGKNLWRRAFDVSFSDMVVDPSCRVSDDGAGCLVKPVCRLCAFRNKVRAYHVINIYEYKNEQCGTRLSKNKYL